MKLEITKQELDPADVDHALSDILASPQFASAPKMSAFLRYVVMQTMCGEAHRIKAYSVGVEALDKPASFDPQNDTSVRTMAKRIRLALQEYYNSATEPKITIRMETGTYRPTIMVTNSCLPVRVHSKAQRQPFNISANVAANTPDHHISHRSDRNFSSFTQCNHPDCLAHNQQDSGTDTQQIRPPLVKRISGFIRAVKIVSRQAHSRSKS